MAIVISRKINAPGNAQVRIALFLEGLSEFYLYGGNFLCFLPNFLVWLPWSDLLRVSLLSPSLGSRYYVLIRNAGLAWVGVTSSLVKGPCTISTMASPCNRSQRSGAS